MIWDGSLRGSKRSKFSPVSNNKFNAVPYQHRRVRSSFTTAAAGDAIKIVHHGIRNPPPVPLHSSEGRIFSDGIASHCTATASGGNGVGGLVVPFRQRRWRPRLRRRRGGSGISFDTNIVVRCNTKPSCLALSSSKERAAALLWASKQCQWRPLALRLLLLLFRLSPPNNQPLCSYDFDSNHTNGQQQWKDIFVSSSNPSFKEGSSPFAVLATDSRRRRGWRAAATTDAVEERHCWELTRNNSITSRCNSQSTIYFFPFFSTITYLFWFLAVFFSQERTFLLT